MPLPRGLRELRVRFPCGSDRGQRRQREWPLYQSLIDRLDKPAERRDLVLWYADRRLARPPTDCGAAVHCLVETGRLRFTRERGVCLPVVDHGPRLHVRAHDAVVSLPRAVAKRRFTLLFHVAEGEYATAQSALVLHEWFPQLDPAALRFIAAFVTAQPEVAEEPEFPWPSGGSTLASVLSADYPKFWAVMLAASALGCEALLRSLAREFAHRQAQPDPPCRDDVDAPYDDFIADAAGRMGVDPDE